MSYSDENEAVVKDIANYCARNPEALYVVAFAEGDRYECRFENGEYDDNDEEIGSPEFEEWYVVEFKVLSVISMGPNKDPRYDFITISRKRMPSLLTCEGKVVYQKV